MGRCVEQLDAHLLETFAGQLLVGDHYRRGRTVLPEVSKLPNGHLPVLFPSAAKHYERSTVQRQAGKYADWTPVNAMIAGAAVSGSMTKGRDRRPEFLSHSAVALAPENGKRHSSTE
jgi:hypothetical protein